MRPGLVMVGEKTAKFAPVEAGQSYIAKVLVQGDNPGLYYIGVVAKMSTQVQTESRAFAVPVVIGDPPPARRPPRRWMHGAGRAADEGAGTEVARSRTSP